MDDNPLSAAIILFLGGLCWVSSLWFPAFYTDTNTLMGYWVLISGWLGIITFQFGWFANLLIFLSVLWMYKYPIRATLVAAVAVLVATQSFWFVVMPGENENVNIIGQGVGFWLWYGSLIILCIGVIFGSDTEAPVKDMSEFKLQPSTPPSPSLHTNKHTSPSISAETTTIVSTSTIQSLDTPLTAANDDLASTKPINHPLNVDEPTPLADLLDPPPPTRRR